MESSHISYLHDGRSLLLRKSQARLSGDPVVPGQLEAAEEYARYLLSQRFTKSLGMLSTIKICLNSKVLDVVACLFF